MDWIFLLISTFIIGCITFLIYYWLKKRAEIHTSDGHLPKMALMYLFAAYSILVGITSVFDEALFSILEQYLGVTRPAHFEWMALGAFVILCFVYYLIVNSGNNQTSSQNNNDPKTEDLRSQLLGELKKFYLKRQKDKMNALSAFEIKLNLKYTTKGTSNETVEDYYLKTKGKVGDFDKLFKKYVNDLPRLLIMGEPGAGKSMLLLKFGLELIERAEKDEHFPIPILLDLASWKNEQATFEEWLEFNLPYVGGSFGISKDAAKNLVEKHEILPLLDGFDEIAEEHRNSCFEKLSTYLDTIVQHQRPNYPQLIICSRISEYEAAKDANVNAAVQIQTLDKKAVDKALEILAEDKNFVAAKRVRKALIHNPNLYTALSSAFFVHTLLEIAQMHPLGFKGNTKTELQQEITNFYVEQELKKVEGCEQLKTKKYLAWLAWKIKNIENKVSLELVDLQPYWSVEKSLYNKVFGVVVGLVVNMYFVLVVGLIAVLIGVLNDELVNGFVFGLYYGLTYGLSFGLFFGLMAGFTGPSNIYPNEIKQINTKDTDFDVFKVFFFVVIFALYGSLVFSLVALLVGLVNGITVYSSLPKINNPYKRFTNQFIFDFVKWAFIFSSVSGFSYIALEENSLIGFIHGGVFGVAIAIAINPLFQHFSLRFVLWFQKVIPLRLRTFLNQSSKTGLLLKDGGKWRFRHQLIHDNLAEWFENNHSNLLSKSDRQLIAERKAKSK